MHADSHEPGNPFDANAFSTGSDETDIPVDPESIAKLIDERDALAAERDRLLRAAADLQNQLNRARKDVAESRRQGVTGVCRDVILALDHFDVALAQDMAGASIESVLGGMKAIRAELIRAMGMHGVTVIDPVVGDEFDPGRHEAIARHSQVGAPEGTVLSVFQVGYILEDRVIRPAKVVVAGPPPAA